MYPKSVVGLYLLEISEGEIAIYQLGKLLSESPHGTRIFPMHYKIRQVLRRSFRLIANVIPLPIILRIGVFAFQLLR